MKIRNTIPLPSNASEAQEIESRFANNIKLGDKFSQVAGVGIAFSKDGKTAYTSAVVLSTTNWSLIHSQKVKTDLTQDITDWNKLFVEYSLCLTVLANLAIDPDIIFVSGEGITHTRQFGLACYVGWAFDQPTIGVAQTWPKSCRQTFATVPPLRGSKKAIFHSPSGKKVGFEIYTQDHSKPIYVSPGHRVSVENAASFALRSSPWFRCPEPLRQAQSMAEAFKDED